MDRTDFAPFVQMLDATCALLSRGKYEPDKTNTALYFRALQRFTLDQVRSAFDAHIADPDRGRFVPVPADLIGKIEGNGSDGRPSSDEAWSIAWGARDERETVVWTDEIAQAWASVRQLAESDKIGARMAFREVYDRLVDEARRMGEAPSWRVCEGFDPERRSAAVRHAVDLLRLPASAAERAAIGGPSTAVAAPAQLLALASKMRAQADVEAPSADAIELARTNELKTRAKASVEAYLADHPEVQR